jgi:glycosyltransferase involved in cell wall biosynthesis
VPSKLFDSCAVGRPVVLAAAGEAPRLASAADAALVVAPGDSEKLAGAIRRLRREPELAEELERAGRAFAAEYLRENQIAKLEAILERAAGREH